MNNLLKEFKFSVGFQKKESIILFNKNYNVTLKLKAYFENDGITKEQEKSYSEYLRSKDSILDAIEKALTNKELANNNYQPSMILFNRDGSYGVLFDSVSDPEDGIVAVIKPQITIMDQHEFL